MKIRMELSSTSIGEAINELKNYRDNLQTKVNQFVSILADAGIEVAKGYADETTDDGDNLGSMILFSKEVTDADGRTTALMYGENQGVLIREWYHGGDIAHAEVSPLLMAEFGSGVYAKESTSADLADVAGRGKFPGQKHAFDEAGWSWVPYGSKEVHHSKGIHPTEPMYHAAQEMKNEIRDAARKAFGDG